jgi:hypothetical protein
VHYVGDSVQDPPGSVAIPVLLGAHEGMHMVGPNGHKVTYLPSVGVTIGRMDWEAADETMRRKLTPDAVIDLYKSAPEGKPYLMVEQEVGSDQPRHTFLSRAEFEGELLCIAATPAAEARLFPENLPELEEPASSSPAGWLQRAWDVVRGEGGATAAETGLEKLGGIIEEGGSPHHLPLPPGGLHPH